MAVRAIDPVTGLPLGAAGTTGFGRQTGRTATAESFTDPITGLLGLDVQFGGKGEVPLATTQPFGISNVSTESIFDIQGAGTVLDPVTQQPVPSVPGAEPFTTAGFGGVPGQFFQEEDDETVGATEPLSPLDQLIADAAARDAAEAAAIAEPDAPPAIDETAAEEAAADEEAADQAARDEAIRVGKQTASMHKLAQMGSFMSSEALDVMTRLLTEGIADDFSINPDGDLVYFLNGEEVGRIPSALLIDQQQTFTNETQLAQLDLEATRIELSENFKRQELAVNTILERENQIIARERIAADTAIASGNWQNALDVQASIDAREESNRNLSRELANQQAVFQQQQMDLQRQAFELEKIQFLTELSTTPTGTVDLFNLSRGLPTVGAGGPIPGGFQRFGSGGLFADAIFGPTSPGIAPQIALEDSDGAGVQVPGAGQAAPPGTGDPNEQRDLFAIPPGLAAAFTGQQPNEFFGASQQAEGGVPLLSQQQLTQFSPSERDFFEALVQLTGQSPDDFAALLAEVAPSQRQATSRQVA